MSCKTTKLRDAIVVALVVGVGASGSAAAQQQEAPTTLDRIEVTGSRIRQVDVETAQPILSVTRETIERSGFKSVSDVLQNISAAGSPAISRSEPLASGEMVGGYYIDLRNLGTERTLILVDGKRLGASVSGYQDVSQIPTVVVERIDVLKDGASSIYGSDAMAGVVNIITRKNFEGAEANAYIGQYGQGDGQKQGVDFMMGFSGDRGSLTMGVEYAKENEVWAKDRWFSSSSRTNRRPASGWTTVSQWGALIDPAGDAWVLDRGADPFDFANYHPLDGTPITGDVSNPNQQMHLITPTERRALFAAGEYSITDNVKFVTDVLYTKREARAQVAGYPLTSDGVGFEMSADSYYNPLGNRFSANGVDVGFIHRGWEVPRTSINELTTFRFTGGLEGSFQFADRYFDWNVGTLYQNSDNLQSSRGNFVLPALRAALGPSFYNADTGRVECGSAAGLAAGTNPAYGAGPGSCVPWNPFIPAGRSDNGGLTDNQVLQQYLFPSLHNTGETTTTSYFANISGALFALPAGDLGFALGYEYRREKGSFVPDALAQSGESTDLAAGPTGGSYSVNELYAELNVPLLSDVVFARELSLSLASRYSDYDTFGETTNSKAGFKWRPMDSLLVRGTWSQGFRAPTIADLYGGGSQSFEYFTDPCDTVFGSAATNAQTLARCAQDIANAATYRQLKQGFVPIEELGEQSPVPFQTVSNPNAEPETSVSRTLGLVWSPGFAPGLNLSVDWWKIRIDNTIVEDTPEEQLNDCYILGVAERCNSFTRDATLGYVATLQYGIRNSGYLETEGYDFDASYRFETRYGNVAVNWQNTYVASSVYKNTNDPDAPITIKNGFGPNFRIRSNLSVMWTMGDFGVSWGARYYSAVKERCFFGPDDECSIPGFGSPDPIRNFSMNRRGSTTFHDVQLSWNAPWNATVAIGANNVFEKYGPPMYSSPTPPDDTSQFSYYGGYDIGRYLYMQYKQRF